MNMIITVLAVSMCLSASEVKQAREAEQRQFESASRFYTDIRKDNLLKAAHLSRSDDTFLTDIDRELAGESMADGHIIQRLLEVAPVCPAPPKRGHRP